MSSTLHRYVMRASVVLGLMVGVSWQSAGCFGDCGENDTKTPIELGMYRVARWRPNSDVLRPWLEGAEVRVVNGLVVIVYEREGVVWEARFARTD